MPRINVVKTEAEAAALLRAPGFRPGSEAIVEGELQMTPSGGSPGRVTILRYGLKEVELEVEAPAGQFLASS